MNDATALEGYRLAFCKASAMLPVFVGEVRRSEFGKPFRATSIAALADSAAQALTEAMQNTESAEPYVEAGANVAEVLWGIGEQLQDIRGEDRSDLCWGLLEGIEEVLKKAGVAPRDADEATSNLPPAITDLPGQHGQRGHLARRAGCAISDLATALTKLMEPDKTAELTLIRRIEALSGVVISAADEDHTDMQYLEDMLTDSP